MKPFAALAAVAIAWAASAGPALARPSYVVDDAHLLSSAAVSQINREVGDFNAQTGKEVVVVTTPSLGGATPEAALERSFATEQVNGVEIFIAKDEKQIRVVGDRASRQFFPNGSFDTIYQAMKPSFAQGNFDGGVETGVSLVLNDYRGHESSLNRNRAYAPSGSVYRSSSGGGGMGWILWLVILAVIFFVIRGIFRAMSGPRMMPPGYGGGPGMPMGMGGGYGGGMGYGGGGGFWSGLLGGLGGAWLGNELFSGRNNNFGDGGSYGGADLGGGNAPDASGWQSDAGQIDTSGSGGGGWGDSGGSWGGGGDSGGGFGGGDSGGGGGGDSGGGW